MRAIGKSREVPIYDSMKRQIPLLEEFVELFSYRDLLAQLVARNIKMRYKRSVLGIAWTMLNPLMMMIVLSLVFSNIFHVTLENYLVYVLGGLVFWNFFSQTTNSAMSELVWGGRLLTRIYVPPSVFVVSALGTGLVNLFLSLVPLFLIMLVTGAPFKPAMLFLPVPILLMAMFALGVGLFLSSVAVYFADVVQMYQIALTAWMYLTPVIYPKEIIPERFRWLFNLNPLYHLLEVFRAPLYVGWLAGPKTLAAASLVAVLSLIIGWWFFSKRADEFAYRV
jgi:ABC-type polysaccharide/polyol phosphate export permease